jgi:hypothetical protein
MVLLLKLVACVSFRFGEEGEREQDEEREEQQGEAQLRCVGEVGRYGYGGDDDAEQEQRALRIWPTVELMILHRLSSSFFFFLLFPLLNLPSFASSSSSSVCFCFLPPKP